MHHVTAERDHAHQNGISGPTPPLLVHHVTAGRDHAHQNGMKKVVAAALAIALAAGCSAVDGSETALPEPDFAPSIVLVADGDTITATEPGGGEVEPDVCRGEVGSIENGGDEPGRWIGTEGYDTGILEPGEEVTLVFRSEGTIEWRAGSTEPADADAAADAEDQEPGEPADATAGPVLLTLDIRAC